jgi:cellobiose phosphorylase
MAADVYALTPHTGRGGWSWYTGSAGWMYRLIVESILGLRLDVDKLYFAPCLPAHWQGFTMHYRYRNTVFHIVVMQMPAGDGEQTGEMSLSVDGVLQTGKAIPLVDDRLEHSVELRMHAVAA